MAEGIIAWGIGIVTVIIATLGYPGIILLMAAESACIPIPSEVVMPLSGYIAFRDGTFDIIGLTIAGTVGNLIGSIIAYWVGFRAGRPFIMRYGKYVLLKESHLNLAESWFKRYGEATTLFSRMLPIIRTFISLPAGMAKMDFKKFVIFTTIGSLPWNFALAYIGFSLGTGWEGILSWFEAFDMIIIAAVIATIVFLIWNHFRKKPKADQEKKE